MIALIVAFLPPCALIICNYYKQLNTCTKKYHAVKFSFNEYDSLNILFLGYQKYKVFNEKKTDRILYS